MDKFNSNIKFYQACENDDLEIIKELLNDKQVSVNWQNPEEYYLTPLQLV